MELKSIKSIIITTNAAVMLYDSDDFHQIGALDMTLLKSEEREPNEVLCI